MLIIRYDDVHSLLSEPCQLMQWSEKCLLGVQLPLHLPVFEKSYLQNTTVLYCHSGYTPEVLVEKRPRQKTKLSVKDCILKEVQLSSNKLSHQRCPVIPVGIALKKLKVLESKYMHAGVIFRT